MWVNFIRLGQNQNLASPKNVDLLRLLWGQIRCRIKLYIFAYLAKV